MTSKDDFDSKLKNIIYQPDFEENPNFDIKNEAINDNIETQFTWRAAIIGSLLGSIVAASNTYMGLKSGWTFSPSIFGAILGYAILKPISKLPKKWGGGSFGMKENCTVQSAATAAGGLIAGFTSAIPSMFRLKLLPPLNQCWDLLFLWTIAAGFYGMFFAVPMRSYFVIQQQLVFPSPTASAQTIRSLHSSNDSDVKLQTIWILISFIGSTLFKILAFFIPFIFDLHLLNWISIPTQSKILEAIDPLWGWYLQISPAFIGTGMLVDLNTALSFFFGDILAWAIIGPSLFYSDMAEVNKEMPYGFNPEQATVQAWLLWVGIIIMFCASFTELFMQYKVLWNGIKGGCIQLWNLIAKVLPIKKIKIQGSNSIDPVPENEQVPTWMWSSGTLMALILTVTVLSIYFKMNVGAGILAALLGFIFSFVGCQSAGETDINPGGVIAKASQFCFSGIPAKGIETLQLNNLIAGSLASSTSQQTVDMVGDLKTGHLLNASPRSQFYAQIIGSIFGIIMAVLMFMLFATAYPCIIELTNDNICPFPVPGVTSWTGVTIALTTDIAKVVPPSCRIACLVFGLITIVTVILKNTYLKKYSAYIPNWNSIGLAFVSPAPYIPLTNLIGALIGLIWRKVNPKYWVIIGVALSSGLIAGEGIGGVFHAIFNIAGLDQKKVSVRFGCWNNLC